MIVVYKPYLWIDSVVPGLNGVELSMIQNRAAVVTHPVFLEPML